MSAYSDQEADLKHKKEEGFVGVLFPFLNKQLYDETYCQEIPEALAKV